ncbi:PREDICTED: protein NRT1/ PTR FAMILY 2.7-like [Nelumbo nucifera]|uniref:Protein NRT1/ PTR FAMILY 2.7-like n=2 Tax=Nelumbo nucifera TaxID=4432 RepID=A0A822Y4U4_NELNU|nr:PREDICTED: protein NRT1/ PTR FAMILY 2.7-like [Nelumbo nucifera]DAD26055.1 TPA_asm: hypothetical protein HUJ06_027523 [Nelumbo nucifera]
MGDTEPKHHHGKLSSEHVEDNAAQTAIVDSKQGGWITVPIITASMLGLTLAASGWISNLIVYLIQEFNVKSIDATQIFNTVSGFTTLLPIAGSITADSLGCFPVITVSSFISLLGVILLMLTATVSSLRPPSCANKGSASCQPASNFQYWVLNVSMALASIGIGGTRSTIATFGGDQFDTAEDQALFFNWYFIAFYVALGLGNTVVVYVDDNVGWGWGYAICIAANVFGIAIFLAGSSFYRHAKHKVSPFTRLAQVVVAAIRKRKLPLSSQSQDYYLGYGGVSTEFELSGYSTPTRSFKFLNRAALRMEGDTGPDDSIAKPWRLCTVEQVEDLKGVIRILPLWSTSIFLSTPIGIQTGLTIIEVLKMDRRVGPHMEIPAGSFMVFTLFSTAISIFLVDRFLYPLWIKLAGRALTPLQRIGVGHFFTIIGMATSAMVESTRLHVVKSNHLKTEDNSVVAPMSALWMVLPLSIIGIGESFHFPGQIELYYQEFPASLRNTSTAMVMALIAVGYYLSTAVIGLVRRVTGWLPDNIDDGRVDNVFWMLAGIGVINFGYYLTCAKLYQYKNTKKGGTRSDHSDNSV